MIRPRVLPAGRNAVIFESADKEALKRLWRLLRYEVGSGVEDVIVGARTVGLIVTPGADPYAVLRGALSRVRVGDAEPDDRDGAASTAPPRRAPERYPESEAAPRTVTVPVTYDGPDLDPTAAELGMPAAEIARRHAGSTWEVDFLGFSPGFAYLSGGDPALWVQRLRTPRLAVPAGSVAIAAGMTAVYPQSTPGGWRIIGSTPLSLFDVRRANPSLLQPGDRVRFHPCDQRFDARSPASGSWPAGVGTSLPGTGDARSAGYRAERGVYVRVLDAGAQSTVQDCGRRGYGHLGVPTAGAADLGSAARANFLVGNPATSAVIESVVTPGASGLALRLGAGRAVAVCGARAEVTVDGLPARQDTALRLGVGAELRVGRCERGLRVYVAISGGIDVEPLLGSRSTDTLSGLGPAPLRPGDILALGSPTGSEARTTPRPLTSGSDTLGGRPAFPGPPLARPGELVCLRASPGPRHDWLDRSGLDTLTGAVFEVSSAADRTGVRLAGPPISLAGDAQLPSEALVAGAVQIAGAGSTIVMLRNHPTTGGYPVVAVVDDTGVDVLSQCPPGVLVRFDLRL